MPDVAVIGHNSGDVLNKAAQSQLRSFVERIETLDDEKDQVAATIKDVYTEAKGTGFDVKVLRRIVAIRKKDRAKLMEENAILDLYAVALGIEDLV